MSCTNESNRSRLVRRVDDETSQSTPRVDTSKRTARGKLISDRVRNQDVLSGLSCTPISRGCHRVFEGTKGEVRTRAREQHKNRKLRGAIPSSSGHLDRVMKETTDFRGRGRGDGQPVTRIFL